MRVARNVNVQAALRLYKTLVAASYYMTPARRDATRHDATQRNAAQHNAARRNATQRKATQRNATRLDTTQPNATGLSKRNATQPVSAMQN